MEVAVHEFASSDLHAFDDFEKEVNQACDLIGKGVTVKQAAAQLSSLILRIYATHNGRLYTRLVSLVTSLKSSHPAVVRALSFRARLRFRAIRKVRGSRASDRATSWTAERLARLAALVAASLGEKDVLLQLNGFQGFSSITFRGCCASGHRIFVKLGPMENIRRSRAVHKACEGLLFIPHILGETDLSFEGYSVLITDLLVGEDVERLEKLKPHQVKELVGSYRMFSGRIQSLRPIATRIGTYTDTEADFAVVSAFALRHPLAAREFSDLLKLSHEERSLVGREKSVVHGDFTHGNYSFSSDGLAAIYDYDALCVGFPCYELSLTIPTRYCARHLGVFARHRLRKLFVEMVRLSGYSKSDWRLALNLQAFVGRRGSSADIPRPSRSSSVRIDSTGGLASCWTCSDRLRKPPRRRAHHGVARCARQAAEMRTGRVRRRGRGKTVNGRGLCPRTPAGVLKA